MTQKEKPDLEPIVAKEVGQATAAEQISHRMGLRALSQRWGQKHARRVDELAREIGSGSTDAAADEQLIHRLAATSTAVSEMLGRAQLQLAERLERFVDDPKALIIVAKSLREVTTVQSSTTRSVQELLAAAATVRAQRRLVDSHARRNWHEDVGGGTSHHARRDPSPRPEASN